MADDIRHVWNPDDNKLAKCGEAVVFGMKMTDDPAKSDCPACKQ